uniref:Core protein VP7 n=1 Tax=Ife virus TaxID=2547357 RepID=A0A482A274_9REOV|nr:VP7 [Ife virus]
MDAVTSRALTVLKAVASILDPRANVESNVIEMLGLAINRYNAYTMKSVTYRANTQEDRNSLFFMCLDFVIASTRANVPPFSPDYTPSPVAIGVLALPEIPFTVEAANTMARVNGVMQTNAPARSMTGPHLRAVRCAQPGRFRQPRNQGITVSIINSWTMDISLGPNGRGLVPLAPPGQEVLMLYFVWREYETFCDAAGATVAGGGGCRFFVDGLEVPAGRIVVWNGIAQVEAVNALRNPGMINIEIIWFTNLDKSFDSVPELRATIENVYSYRSGLWHALRAVLLDAVGLPPLNPPMYPLNTIDQITVFLLLSALADVYSVLKPIFEINGARAGPAPQRGQMLNEYRQ